MLVILTLTPVQIQIQKVMTVDFMYKVLLELNNNIFVAYHPNPTTDVFILIFNKSITTVVEIRCMTLLKISALRKQLQTITQ